MNQGALIVGFFVFAVVTASYIARGSNPKRVLADLCVEEIVSTVLPKARVRTIVAHILRRAVPAVAEERDGFECVFEYPARGGPHRVTLRVELAAKGAHRNDGVRVRIGVDDMRIPGDLHDPELNARFQEATALRKRVVDALKAEDASAVTSEREISWTKETRLRRRERA